MRPPGASFHQANCPSDRGHADSRLLCLNGRRATWTFLPYRGFVCRDHALNGRFPHHDDANSPTGLDRCCRPL